MEVGYLGLQKYNNITPYEQKTSKVVGFTIDEPIKDKRHKLYIPFVKQIHLVNPTFIYIILEQVELHHDKSLTIEMMQEKLHRLAICVVDYEYKISWLKLWNNSIYARDL